MMKILMTGPDNNPERSIGGILTIVNIILNNAVAETSFFDRDLGERKSSKAGIYLKKILSYRSLLKKGKFDLVHFHFSFDIKSVIRELLYVSVAKMKRIPIIMHLHGGDLTFKKSNSPFVKWLIASPDMLIVLHEAEKESLCRLYEVPAEKIKVLKNCIDLNEIPAFAARSSEYNKLIYLGRIHRDKGLKEIVEACRLIKDTGKKFNFEVYGSGPDKEWFIDSLKELLHESFEYKGIVWGDEKWHSLNNSDIFLLPSYAEGMPMALLEAMALGKVAVVSDDESFKKVIRHSENGMLARKRSSQDLAETILSILGDSGRQIKIGENARASIMKEYSSHSYMSELTGIYSETIKN